MSGLGISFLTQLDAADQCSIRTSVDPRKFGASAAQKHLKDILATARDQVCRTKTTCARDFCRCVPRTIPRVTVVGSAELGWALTFYPVVRRELSS